MSDSIVRALTLYSLQLAVVLVLGALLPGLLRIRSPRLCLSYWYVLLAVALVVPFAALSANAPLPVDAGVVAVWVDDFVTVAASTASRGPTAVWILAVLALGAAARLSWVGLGARALSRMRREARELAPPTRVVEALADPLVKRTRYFLSPRISTPTTFGVLHPTVLVPEAFTELSSSEQEAVLCHELMHVKRRDWLAVVLEEAVRVAFWFHPGVWVVLRRISLSREEVVDREVVGVLSSRRGYLAALVRVAEAARRSRRLPMPAAAMLRGSDLRRRVRSLLTEEVPMSRSRFLISMTALAVLLGASIAIAALAFPLAAQEEGRTQGSQRAETRAIRLAQEDADEAPPVFVTGDVQKPVNIHRVAPQYTEEAREARIQGMVILQTIIDKEGNITDIKVMKGLPLGLSEAAMSAVRQWKYEPATLHGEPVAVYFNLTINFVLGDKKKDEEEGLA